MKYLKHFKKIGWDFDGTLVGHPSSYLMWEYILQNPYDQEHHLITFRSGGFEKYVDFDFEKHGSILRADDFTTFNYIDHEIWLDFKTRYPFGEIELDSSIDHPYINWKGQMCANLGVEVIIDDMTHCVAPGCEEHGIVLYHPDEWITL